jgi:hypothetical protein
MYDVAKTYRLDPFDTFWEEDLGASLNATVIPMLKKSTTGTHLTASLLFFLFFSLLCCHLFFIYILLSPLLLSLFSFTVSSILLLCGAKRHIS